MNSLRQLRYATIALCVVGLMLAASSCPRIFGGTAKVVTVLAWDANPVKADVPNSDIEELWVTITKITMVPADDEEGPEPPDKEAKAHVTVFDAADSAPIDVNLKDLTGVSALITAAEVPADVYNQIRLYIEDPVMVLTDPEKATYTNIHLTANSRLFVTGEFEIPPAEVVIQLDFGGVKIVERGNGNYTWTPQLQANVDVAVVETTSTGTIGTGSLDTGANTFTLFLTEGEVYVNYSDSETVIYDTDGTTQVDDSYLAEGQDVQVTGFLIADELTATSVWILPPSP